MNFLFLILTFLAFPAFCFADQNESNVEDSFISAALASLIGFVGICFIALITPDIIIIDPETSKNGFDRSGYTVLLPKPTPPVSSAPPPTVPHANANLFWHKFVIVAAVLAIYYVVTLLVERVPYCRVIDDNYKLQVTKCNSETNRHLQETVDLLKEQLTLQQNQIKLIRRELSTVIVRNDVLSQEHRQLSARLTSKSSARPQAPFKFLTYKDKINSSSLTDSDTDSESDSDAEQFYDALFSPISRIAATNRGKMLGKVALNESSELTFGSNSSSSTLARINRAVSISRLKHKTSRIFDLSTHAGRERK